MSSDSWQAALLAVDAASALHAKGHVDSCTPPALLLVVLLHSPAALWEGSLDLRDGVMASLDVMGRCGVPDKFSGNSQIARVVAQIVERPVVAGQPGVVGGISQKLMATLQKWNKTCTNPKGFCDVGNVTRYKDGADVPKGVDAKVYEGLWGIQRYFADPGLLKKSQEGWDEFQAALTELLDVLDKAVLCGSASSFGKERRELVKYLTSPDLLKLELADCQLRRSVLLQAAILLKWVESTWSAAEDDEAAATGGGDWQSKVFTRVRNETSQGEKLMASVMKALGLGPDGAPAHGVSGQQQSSAKTGFKSFVDTVLRREVYWIDWKSRYPVNERPKNPAAGVKRSFEESVYSDDADVQRDVRRLSVGTRLQDRETDGIPSFESGRLNLMDAQGEAYTSGSAGPIRDRDIDGREGRWATIKPLDAADMLRKGVQAQSQSQTLSAEEDIRQVLEDDLELEEEYRNGKDNAYVWYAIRRLSEKKMEFFLKVVNVSDAYEAPPFSLSRLQEGEPAAKRPRVDSPASGAVSAANGTSGTNVAGAGSPADADMKDIALTGNASDANGSKKVEGLKADSFFASEIPELKAEVRKGDSPRSSNSAEGSGAVVKVKASRPEAKVQVSPPAVLGDDAGKAMLKKTASHDVKGNVKGSSG